MDVSDYNEQSFAARDNRPYDLPEDFFTNDELDTDKMLNILEVFGYISYDDNDMMILHNKLKLEYPDTYEFLYMIMKDEHQAAMDKLVDDGYLDLSIDDKGHPIYIVTEKAVNDANS